MAFTVDFDDCGGGATRNRRSGPPPRRPPVAPAPPSRRSAPEQAALSKARTAHPDPKQYLLSRMFQDEEDNAAAAVNLPTQQHPRRSRGKSETDNASEAGTYVIEDGTYKTLL